MKPMWIAALALCWLWPELAAAQVVVITNASVIVPPAPPTVPTPPSFRPRPVPQLYRMQKVEVQATVRDQIAQVQLSQVFQNISSQVLEAQIVFPMPEGAAISDLTLLVDGKEFGGKILKKEEARSIYESIVRQRRDPALLEYLGQGLFQTSVFPIPPGAQRTVQIRYSQLLKKDAGLVDLVLPLGTHKHTQHAIETVDIQVRLETQAALKTVYSPTHGIDLQRSDDKHAVCKVTLRNVLAQDDFRLLYGTNDGPLAANLISFKPQNQDDGYFVLLVSPEIRRNEENATPRSLIYVLDRSGSMNGEKIKQAREALKYLVRQLRPQDTFNIVIYDSNVEVFRPELQRADPETIKSALGYVEGIYAGGSTNIDGALQTSLKLLSSKQLPSYVLFFTDGLPTVGERDERRIAVNAKSVNQVAARLFNFGVGYDVNSRLLDRLSRDNRGQSIYVRPSEDIEASVSALYNKIASPLLTDIALKFEFDTPQESSAPALINRSYPKQVTDLFHGEQLVLVGRYRKGGVAKVTLTGRLGNEQKSFSFPVTFADKSEHEGNGFAEKLWATRRVGEIIDEIDLHGHNQELVNEMVDLSIRHGIITPYTSFLADDGVRLADRESNGARALDNVRRGLANESGAFGVEQRAIKGQLQKADNFAAGRPQAEKKAAAAPGLGGGFGGAGPTSERARDAAATASSVAPAAPAAGGLVVLDEKGEAKSVNSLKQVGLKTFFRKENAWQDSTVTPEQTKGAIRIKQFSKEYFDLAASHGGTLAKYLVFDEPVVLNLADKTYRIDPPDPDAK